MRLTRRATYVWFRGLGWLAAALCVALPRIAHAAPLLAQDEGGKSYVAQYTIVGLCVGLAIMIACRPSRREEEVPERFDL